MTIILIVLLGLVVAGLGTVVWAFAQEQRAHRSTAIESDMLRRKLKRIKDVEAEAARIWGEAALEATMARDEAQLERQTRDELAKQVAALRVQVETVVGTRLFDHDGEVWTVWATLPPPSLHGGISEEDLGWLTFESHDHARVLSPVPTGWEYCDEEDLSMHYEAAIPALPSRVR
jgi:hypothetical protein